MLGDVCGQPGMRALYMGLNQLIKEYRADFVVVNGEILVEIIFGNKKKFMIH